MSTRLLVAVHVFAVAATALVLAALPLLDPESIVMPRAPWLVPTPPAPPKHAAVVAPARAIGFLSRLVGRDEPRCDGPLLAEGPPCVLADWGTVEGTADCWIGWRLGDGGAEVGIYPGCRGDGVVVTVHRGDPEVELSWDLTYSAWPRWIAALLVGDGAVSCVGDDDTFAGCPLPHRRSLATARWLLATVDGGFEDCGDTPPCVRPTQIWLDWPPTRGFAGVD